MRLDVFVLISTNVNPRHTFNPWLWGLESEMQPGEQGRNVDFIIATIPLEVTLMQRPRPKKKTFR